MSRTAVVLVFALTLLGFPPAPPATGLAPPATVIATTDVGDLNVLHSDFANPDGVPLPPGLPPVTVVDLPSEGSFEERLAAAQAGIFSKLQRGVLYHVRGTRLLLFAGGQGTYSVLDNRDHGTGTASSAVGLQSGTSPDSFLLFLGDQIGHPPSWDWVLEQSWIDLITTSAGTVLRVVTEGTCPDATYVRQFSEQGRVWFTYAGNQDQFHPLFAPPGIPEAYRVGGVDENGRTYYAHMRDDNPVTLADNPTRPYETGDLFYREVASGSSLDARVWAGGTSFATPTTAGRAANLLRFARGLLGDESGGLQDGKLAVAAEGMSAPASGPLADGDLTSAELVDVLHHVAVPAEPASPARYLVEGYGALNDAAMARAEKVLAGIEPEPARPEEDAAYQHADSATGALFPAERCDPPTG